MLVTTLGNFFSRYPINGKTLWIGYSGGLDSTVLLHFVTTLQPYFNYKIQAIHINHGLNPRAEEWQDHCKAVCTELNVSCQIIKVNAIAAIGESPEASARKARYQAFIELLHAEDYLLTAHHQEDQAETLLLQLLRGAGVKGLAAMPEIKSLGKGYLLRPLLTVSRQQLQNYAQQHQLRWIEDDSNSNEDFDRNYLRHQIMPILTARWPEAAKTLQRSATWCGENLALITELAKIDFATIFNSQRKTLTLELLKQLTIARQNNVIRYWLDYLNLPLPSAKKLAELHKTILTARADKMPLLSWSGVEIRRFQNELYGMEPLKPFDNSKKLFWDLQQPLILPDNLGIMTAEMITQKGITLPQNAIVEIRFRQGGEICRFNYPPYHRSLKKLMQQWHIPPWLRDRIPLIYFQDQLILVLK